VLADVFGADIDLDPVAEDDYEFEALPLDGDCDSACLAGTHDGVVNLTPDACSYILSRPDSATGPNPPEKQPEFIDIRIDALDENEACTVLVFVKTVPNPGTGNDFYEPTGCRELAYTTGDGGNGDPIIDTFTLNEGVKTFDNDGVRLAGPESSLQLTCIFPEI
jgi:hypothetical protein